MREIKDSLLFSAQKINEKPIKNRWVVAPMTRVSAEDDGKTNARMKQYYERFAKGGFGAIITEGIYTDTRYSQGYFNQSSLATKDHAEAWQSIVDGVHEAGATFIAQLMHAGGQSQGNRYSEETAAPSAIPPKGNQLEFYGGKGPYNTPKALTEADIAFVKEGFVSAARHAKMAGFDGVEIHGANGYLLDQFLTDYLNQRDDEYGGSIENRVRLILEVIASVRTEVGPDFIVGIRISQTKVADSEHKWAGGEDDAREIFTRLGQSGVDYIHVTDANGALPGFGEGTMSMAEAARVYGNVRIIANGHLNDPETALKMIENAEADFISLGTGALANPDFPERVKHDVPLEDFNPGLILMPKAVIKDQELEMDILNYEMK